MRLDEARAALAALCDAADPRPGAVTVKLEGPVAAVVLDNPTARGAITLSMMVDLADAVGALRDWTGAAVVLSSADPRAFCAGGHLGQVRRAVGTPAQARTMCLAMTSVLDEFLDLPQVSVAAIGGLAVGGGAELVTACDFRVAHPAAQIHFIHAQLGIAPGWGGVGRLLTHVGRREGLRVLLDARPLSAVDAERMGLVDALDNDVLAGARTVLDRVVGHAPQAVRAIKAQVVAARRGRGEGEADAFAAVWGGVAHRAALDAMGKPAS